MSAHEAVAASIGAHEGGAGLRVRLSARATARIGWALFAAASVSAAMGTLLLRSSGSIAAPGHNGGMTMGVVFPVFAGVGALILSRRPGNVLGWLLSVQGVTAALTINGLGFGYVHYALFGPGAGAWPAGQGVAWLSEIVDDTGFALGPLLLLLFPTGRPPSSRWRPVVAVCVVLACLTALTRALAPGPLGEFPDVSNPAGVSGTLGSIISAIDFTGQVLVVLVWLLGVASVFGRFRGAQGVERQQLKWFTYAAALVAFGLVVVIAGPAWLAARRARPVASARRAERPRQPVLGAGRADDPGLDRHRRANGAAGVNAYSSGLNSTGVQGRCDNGVNAFGVWGRSNSGIGVVGTGGPTGVSGTGSTGVRGFSTTGEGVHGEGGLYGVFGFSSSDRGIGVLGQNSDSPNGVGVRGQSTAGTGVVGLTTSGTGVFARSTTGIGIRGFTSAPGPSPRLPAVEGFSDGLNGIGVLGECDTGSNATGVWGMSDTAWGVFSTGKFGATGTKSAIVPHPDGTHRALYCMESPESWFEDFGTGRLANGTASVALDPEFAAVVHTDTYHVFLTERGESNGLYVATSDSRGFTVRERSGGTSSVQFSYRVVARRKDVVAPRLEKVALAAEMTRRPTPPSPVHAEPTISPSPALETKPQATIAVIPSHPRRMPSP